MPRMEVTARKLRVKRASFTDAKNFQIVVLLSIKVYFLGIVTIIDDHVLPLLCTDCNKNKELKVYRSLRNIVVELSYSHYKGCDRIEFTKVIFIPHCT